MSFNRVTYWIMGEGLLTGVKMTQRQLHYQNPLMGNSSQKAGDIEHTALIKRLECVPCKWLWLVPEQLGYFLFLPGTWYAHRLFFTSWFIWEWLSAFFIVYSRREEPSETGQFQGLPETVLWCLPYVFRNFPRRWNVSTSEETAT